MEKRCLGQMTGGHWCGLRSQDTTQTQESGDTKLIQEHHLRGSYIRQRMLGSTISVYSGASRHGNEDTEADVRRNAV